MSILTRSDGTQFVIQAYRELLKYSKKSLLAQRIRDIAEQQGQFVRLFKRRSGEYEAVFSSEPGTLLGESVKQYFQHTKNLIYCESITANAQLLLVVIKEGNVFIDRLVSKKQLNDELLALTTQKTTFHLVVSGNAPIVEHKTQGTENLCHFPQELTASFEHINKPLLPRLPAVPAVRLLPLPLALKAERLHSESLVNTTIVLVVLTMSLIGVFAYIMHHPHNKTLRLPTTKKHTPYARYHMAMKSPPPTLILGALSQRINELYQMPGWQTQFINLNRSHYKISVNSTGGNLQALHKWATAHHYKLQLNPEGVSLSAAFAVPSRKLMPPIYSLNATIETLIDTITHSIADTRIQLLQSHTYQKSTETGLLINLSDVSSQQIQYLASILDHLPVTLNTVQLEMRDNALISGAIQLSIWGK